MNVNSHSQLTYTKDCVLNNFKTFVQSHGYNLRAPIGLISKDKSLLFTNSSIVPYKHALLSQQYIAPCAQIQNCFRSNVAKELPYSFTMLGLLAEQGYLSKIMHDAASFLRSILYPSNGVLIALGCAEDHDLISAWYEITDDPISTLHLVAPQKCVTRWNYGENKKLTGRGISILWKNPSRSFHQGCNIDCDCGRFQIVGTIILIHSAEKIYVEAAFGLEGILATHYNGDIFALPEYQQIIAHCISLKYKANQAQIYANQLIASLRLLDAGCTPTAKGAGYILRKLMRSLPNELIHECKQWIPNTQLIQFDEEHKKMQDVHNKGISAAQRYIKKHPNLHIDARQLQTTFGINLEQATSLIFSE